jgi:hypothetical protein
MIGVPTRAGPKALSNLAACALFCGASVSAYAGSVSPYVVTIEQDGANVVAAGAGEIDTTGFPGSFASGGNAYSAIGPDIPYIYIGTGGWAGYGISITGQSNFGAGTLTFASASSGDVVGIQATLPTTIYLPSDYASNTALSDSATWDDATLASLGLTPGTYVWTWGSGADQSYTLNVLAPTATPLPAALPFFAGGLGIIGLLARRRRKAQAS